MTERHPIYSGQATRQPIGYIQDDQAFDLFDRPCATYEGNTGLLRDPKNKAVVGYVSLSDIFVGSSWMAQELFSKTGPTTPQASLEELEGEDSDAAVCRADDDNAEKVDAVQPIAQAPPSHHTVKADLSVASTPMHLEMAGVEEHALHATDITTFPNPSEQDKVVGTVLPTPTGPHLGDASTEQSARPQEASDAGKGFASDESGSDHPSRTWGEAAPALQPEADANLTMPESSDERGAFDSAQSDEPSGGDGMPRAVEAFMRHLSEYLHSSNHQAPTPSSDDAPELKLSPSAEAQKDIDRAPFPGEIERLEGGSSGSTQHSGSPVELAQDNHRESNSGASGGMETNNASRDVDQALLGVLKDVEKNSSGT